MFNYIKFAIFQIISFLLSVPSLIKFKHNPDKFSSEDKFKFLHNHTKRSLNLVNINLSIVGRDNIPSEPVLFVINHASMLDSFILAAVVDRPIGCLIAAEPVWENIPIVSDWANLLGCVYINRQNNREGIKSIIKASKTISSGHSMAVFPEGDLTWVNDPNSIISEFRSGALKIAYKANCPIVPIVIKNSKCTYDGYQPIGKIQSENVEVEFLPAIYDHIKNPKIKSVNLANMIRFKMIDSINLFNKKSKSNII